MITVSDAMETGLTVTGLTETEAASIRTVQDRITDGLQTEVFVITTEAALIRTTMPKAEWEMQERFARLRSREAVNERIA